MSPLTQGLNYRSACDRLHDIMHVVSEGAELKTGAELNDEYWICTVSYLTALSNLFG